MSDDQDPAANARRRRLPALAIALTAALALLCCTGGTGALLFSEFLGKSDDPVLNTFGCGQDKPIEIKDGLPIIEPYDAAQMRNAAVIINVGAQMRVPPRGWVIAVATAMQESRLSNLPHLGASNDHDSIGLFQQRPSQGWGTPQQLLDPEYTSRKFYEKLLEVRGWQKKRLTDAAQRVQRSAFPDAYAKHEAIATQIVNALTKGAARAAGAGVPVNGADLRCAAGADIAASGWTLPIPGAVGSGFRTASRPSHNGVDIGAAKGTEIRAAASGRVLVARCDPDRGGVRSCDVDGFPGKGGCGWFVDILHANQIITRYCHMVRKPLVNVNDMVEAGQVIGNVGSSGNSSGPHLHFEVHVKGDRSSRGAINPVPFMRDRGATLQGNG
ncbi:peptidase M23-like protein [Micromonospora pisi]|uniref:Peptidase M23-like protein n=1 Tax=Micromonospora pisi TaxID=589240 RepID=A0A495JKM8_9ACTN|nr:M23 family metallopeptidase [Micromonospora pisi]RKR89610.1 peptidase M23-like protein [Micromonospora pisi]